MYILKNNPCWPVPEFIPEASVKCEFDAKTLSFEFSVSEPPECFRMQCQKDGEPCWQDSCVEIFVHSPSRGMYYNFECSCTGFCLAEYGTQRANRIQFENYDDIHRIWQRRPELIEGRYYWALKVVISRELIGLKPDESVCGNLYKCASGAACPHYLTLFPIDTPTPDFHRPEFFKPIWAE